MIQLGPAPTLLGLVENVTGSTVTVGLSADTLSGLIYVEGDPYRVGQVGSFVRIPQGYANLYAIVTQAGVAPGKQKSVVEVGPESTDRRWLTVEVVGETQPNQQFSRGVHRYPTIGDEAHLVTDSDLVAIYGSAMNPNHVEIGSLSSARAIPAYVDVNKLVTRHSAVVGATGTGKSTTVAGLLNRITDAARFPSARVVLLDLHGEYVNTFGKRANVLSATATTGGQALHIPYWALQFDDFISVAFGALDDAGRARVADWVLTKKRAAVSALGLNGISAPQVTVDTALPFSIKELWHDLRFEMDATYPAKTAQLTANAAVLVAGDPDQLKPTTFKQYDGTTIIRTQTTLNIRRQTEALYAKLSDPRYAFLFDPGPWKVVAGKPSSDLGDLLAQWMGETSGKSIAVLDLSGAPTSILIDLVGALLRLLFDALFWGRSLNEGGRHRPLLVVMEEAHVYLSDADSRAAESTKRIVKEGRKYGIGAMLVSQRPSEIDSTILSQCGTLIAMRLGNGNDRNHVRSATTESLASILDLLPALRTGEAIVLGEGVHLPTRTMIHLPPQGERPNSDDPRVVEIQYGPGETGPGGWDRPLEKQDYSDLVHAWRTQNPKSRRTT